MSRIVALSVIVASAAAVGATRVHLESPEGFAREETELLYLPNGDYLRAASLGQGSLLADAIYLWAIQYYSDYERKGRYEYVEHIFGDVLPKLDPHYIDPYWLGALILIIEARDFEAGLGLLDQGFKANPHAWLLPYFAGWECNYAGQFDRAAEYFRKAAAVPDAPYWVRRMEAGMTARSGRLEDAILQWAEVLEDPSSDALSRTVARRQIRDLRVRLDLRLLTAAVEGFKAHSGRFPSDLEELVRTGFIGTVPVDPEGEPYPYDPETGEIGAVSGRVLGAR